MRGVGSGVRRGRVWLGRMPLIGSGDRFPEGLCGCGALLADARDLGVVDRYQQVEVSLMTATLTRCDQHAVRCGCGALHTRGPAGRCGGGSGGLWPESAGVGGLSDGRAFHPGAAVCADASVADRCDAVAGVRARRAEQGRGADQ